eukprot:TRINITY_DN5921_c1_g3_i1.p1 TRINITY_DN5921_c1_g3~~TRINITY_DN5921_c1_g3_i1.p1  ORF type:complete len:233 (-),score=41.20 TRINITY_DN5921_c1_g3_i1:235-933(-)
MVSMVHSLKHTALIFAALLATSFAEQSKTVFDYTFAANCPVCRWYGNNTLRQLYEVDGVASGVDFRLHVAIRKGLDQKYQCVAEAPGCPMTRYFLCAFKSTEDIAAHVAYLTCFNSMPKIGPKDVDELNDRAKICAEKTKLDWAQISTCSAGDLGDKLQLEAEEYFVKRYPEFSKPGPESPFGVPHVYIDGAEVGPKGWAEKVDFKATLKLLCQDGLKAEACKETSTSEITV